MCPCIFLIKYESDLLQIHWFHLILVVGFPTSQVTSWELPPIALVCAAIKVLLFNLPLILGLYTLWGWVENRIGLLV